MRGNRRDEGTEVLPGLRSKDAYERGKKFFFSLSRLLRGRPSLYLSMKRLASKSRSEWTRNEFYTNVCIYLGRLFEPTIALICFLKPSSLGRQFF